MAKVSNLGTRVYLDEHHLSGVLNAAVQNVNQQLPVITCFSDDGPRRATGGYDHDHSHTGFFDGDSGEFDDQIFAMLNVDEDHYLCHLFGAYAEGSVAYESVVKLASQPRVARIGEAIMLSLGANGSNGMSRGLVLMTETITGTTNGTGYNQGTTVAGTIYQVTFRVISGSFTSITLKIQESSDDGAGDAYADISGLTATLTAVGVERDTTIAATEAWKRVVVSAFSGTSCVVLVTAGNVKA